MKTSAKRMLWTAKDVSAITDDLRAADEATRHQRAKRAAFLLQEFGPPAGMVLTGGLNAMLAISELQSSFLNGNFMATILLCQVFVESSLGGSFAFSGDEEAMLGSFKSLIDRSVAERRISKALGERLHHLREDVRNAYGHPRPYLNPRKGLLDRVFERRLPLDKLAEADAREAIQLAVDSLREGCPSWTPEGQSSGGS
jgi:hypothetical protein